MNPKKVFVQFTALLLIATPLWPSPLWQAYGETFDLAYFEERIGFTATDEQREQIAPVLKKFNKSRTHRALAATISSNGWAFGAQIKAATQLQASLSALRSCNEQRQKNGVAAHCELLVAGDDYIPTGSRLRANVTDASPSMVWRIDGGANTLYLGGSFHLMKQTLYPLPKAFDHAFTNSSRIALESNPILATDPARAQSTAQLSTIDPKKFKSSQTKAQRRAFNKFARAQGIDRNALQALQPVASALNLSLVGYMSLGFLPTAGLEAHFARRASQQGKPIIEVEDFSEVLGRIVSFPLEDQHEMLADTIQEMQSVDYDKHLLMLFDAWLTGNSAELYKLADASTPGYSNGSRKLSEYIIGERNQTMAQTIKGYLAEDQSTFVMVGALHLVGENGLVALLRNAGYTPVRLANSGDVWVAQK